MANDIAPEIYEKIQKDIADELEKSDKLKEMYDLIASGKADYKTANCFSEEIGNIYSRALKNNINSGVLPDGKMYYNIAERTIRPAMEECYGKVSDVTFNIQSDLNKTAGIGIKTIKPELNSERIEGIINRSCSAESFDDVAWLLDEPIVNFAQSVVDDSVKVNAGFHEKSGLNPTITRTVSGKCCKWCDNLAGTYNYRNAPDDIYRRHEHCRCQVLYNPGNSKKYQNVHTKKWVDSNEIDKIEKRRYIGIKSDTFILSNYDGTARRYVNVNEQSKLLADAKSGKRHKDIYTDAVNHKKNSLQKSIASHISQVERHADKIKNPSAYDVNWDTKTQQQKNGLLHKWEKDMKRNAEQAEVEIAVWKERFGNEQK